MFLVFSFTEGEAMKQYITRNCYAVSMKFWCGSIGSSRLELFWALAKGRGTHTLALAAHWLWALVPGGPDVLAA